MAERLPFGEIRPTARPIDAFIQPGQQNVAGAARPEMLGAPSGINAIQRASAGNVESPNEFAQFTASLAPFSERLQTLVGQGMVSYAQGKIEQGYYTELKNQQARATLSLQLQQEQGAANAAGTIGALQKVDPAGAQLLKEANPWKRIGQERARAQLAGAEIDNVLASDASQNAGYLARLAPGSPELMQRKATLTQGVLSRYGLTGDEPSTQFYVTPKLNQAWDAYTAQHNKLHSAAVYQQTVLDTSALGVSGIQDAVQNGFTMPNGQVLKPGTPEWAAEGHKRLTGLLDGQLRLLAPDDRAKAMENLRKDFMAFSGAPYVWDLITGIRVGDSSIPYEKRPTWGAAQASELLEDRQKAANRRLEEANNDQSFKKLDAQNAWNAGPGRFAPGTPEATEAILKFRQEQLGKGFLGVDDFIVGATKDREALQATLFPSDPREAANFSTAVAALPANVWTDDPNALKNIQDAAWQIASKESNPEARNRKYAELMGDVEKARKAAGQAAKDVVPGAKTAALEDLDSPEVRAIRKAQNKGTGGGLGASIFQNAANGVSVAQAVAATGDKKLTAAAGQLERLYQAAMQNKINAWQASHPTQVLSPEARLNLIAEAKQEVRKSDQYAAIMTPLLGRAPAGTAAAVSASVLEGGRYATTEKGQTFGQVPSQQLRGVSRQNFQNLPDSTVKGYAIRPVIDGPAMRDELKRVGRGDGVSQQMNELAKRAGISPYRYLLEQLKFYPALDDQDGSLRQMLQEKAGRQRTAQSISRAQLPSALPSAGGTGGLAMLPTGYNPLGPGSWLMSMIAPPAQAIQSFIYPRGGGGGMGGGNYVATTGFGYSADRKTQTLHGIKGRPGYDANHGVGNDHVHHGADDAQTAMALAKYLKGKGWPITEFKPWGSVGRHQDPGHYDGRTFDVPVATKDHQRVIDDINAFYSGRRGGSGGGGNWQGYMKRLAYLETRIRNIPNAEGSPGRGYFQAFPAFSSEAIAASGGIDPRDSDYGRAAQASWAWIQRHNKRAAAAIKAGRYDEADQLLRGTWPSLPGGSQAQSDQVQREARRYLGG
jgi:hypothetical protein